MISSIGSSQSTAIRQSMSALSNRPAPPDPQEMFTRLDADSDGKVTLDEMQALPSPRAAAGLADTQGQTEPSTEDLFAEFDSDGDGVVSFAEFEARRPPEPLQGPPPQMATGGSLDLASLFGAYDDEATGSLASLLA
ncbi:MAG: EF-hand domain-containing protein [bacterium]|nr:EF-hand domain-containing protein [bacterium]